jgi:plasmid stabilization system protein ParE
VKVVLSRRAVARIEEIENFVAEQDPGAAEEGEYRIVYRVKGDTVEVVTVLQGKRLLPRGDVP